MLSKLIILVHYFASEAERLVMALHSEPKCCPVKCLVWVTLIMAKMLKHDSRFG